MNKPTTNVDFIIRASDRKLVKQGQAGDLAISHLGTFIVTFSEQTQKALLIPLQMAQNE